MSALRLAWTELRRVTATRGVVVTLVAMLLIPSIYGGMYLYANRDPYGALDKVPAALVVQDEGATRADGSALHAGRDLADQLLADRAFGWTQVDAATAAAGVDDGTYDFSVTIPADFSRDIASLGSASSQRATIVLATNDATNYLARTIATSATERIRATLAAQIGTQAAQQSLAGFTTVSTQLTRAAQGAGDLASGAATARAAAGSLASGATSLASGASSVASGASSLSGGATALASGTTRLDGGSAQLSQGLATLAAATAGLPAATTTLADGAAATSSGAAQVATATQQLEQGSASVSAGLDQLGTSLRAQLTAAGVPQPQVDAVVAQVGALEEGSVRVTDGLTGLATGTRALAAGTAQVSDGAHRLASSAPALAAGVSAAASAAAEVSTGASTVTAAAARLQAGAAAVASGSWRVAQGSASLASGSQRLEHGLGSLTAGSATLRDRLVSGAASVPTVPAARQASVAADVASPVAVTTDSASRASTYGAGLAPFFLALSLWIGGYVLFMLVRPLSRRALAADQRPWHVAVGGWLVPALLGVVQAVLVTLVVTHGVGVEPVHLVGTTAFLALVSITFIAIIQTLTAWFGPVGQFLALVLMIVQLVSAGGTFPWQTLPAPLWGPHDVLPMGYAIRGLRTLFYGGDVTTLALPAVVLLAYLVGALALTTLAAGRQRRWTVARLRPAVSL